MGNFVRPFLLLLILAAIGLIGWWYYSTVRVRQVAATREAIDAGPPNDLDMASGPGFNDGTIEVTDYKIPDLPADDPLADDRIEDKRPAFDPTRVHPTPIAGREINLSAAVHALDVPILYPDGDRELLTLRPSYADAAARDLGAPILPSGNMLDGKAKQFDDGLYAAIELASFQGGDAGPFGDGTIGFLRRLKGAIAADSPATPFLAAGLVLAGEASGAEPAGARRRWIADFEADETRSKPIGFYTWTPDLEAIYRTRKFFQQPLAGDDLAIARDLAEVIRADPGLMKDYERIVALGSGMTNPPELASMVAWKEGDEAAALLPPASSREGTLFQGLFALGVPEGANLMNEFIRQIRSGSVDLKPKAGAGWYDHQVYALETLLLPERGAEDERLLKTRAYKARLVEAFKALMTKRRETHAGDFPLPASEAGPPPQEPPLEVEPRLRVEPLPTFYLRTARSYDFLAGFLESAVGVETLKGLHGRREDGEQSSDLATELAAMRDLFYGLYFLSCEDIGQMPESLADEPADRDRCTKAASEWLAVVWDDPDLRRDTRVSVPIFLDRERGVTRVWATLGVRLARLNVGFARPPSVRKAGSDEPWAEVPAGALRTRQYLIPTDEFAEIRLQGRRVLDRDELRAACDKLGTKEAIVAGLED